MAALHCLVSFDVPRALPALLLLALALAACSADIGAPSVACTVKQRLVNPQGALHGQPCTNDAECLYGLCHHTAAVADFGFCTKFCDCGQGAACADENGGGQQFVCQRFIMTAWPDEPPVCTQVCEQLSDCPPGYTQCAVLTGSHRVCLAR